MKIYVDKNALQDYTTKLIAKEKTIFATKNEVGSPLVASTVAGMIDHDKIYVYVGSETGYTSGNWYYWDGSAWVSGGIYNSEGFVLDDTLTSATLPAQAKAVGDAVDQLSNKIEDVTILDVVSELEYVANEDGGVWRCISTGWSKTKTSGVGYFHMVTYNITGGKTYRVTGYHNAYTPLCTFWSPDSNTIPVGWSQDGYASTQAREQLTLDVVAPVTATTMIVTQFYLAQWPTVYELGVVSHLLPRLIEDETSLNGLNNKFTFLQNTGVGVYFDPAAVAFHKSYGNSTTLTVTLPYRMFVFGKDSQAYQVIFDPNITSGTIDVVMQSGEYLIWDNDSSELCSVGWSNEGLFAHTNYILLARNAAGVITTGPLAWYFENYERKQINSWMDTMYPPFYYFNDNYLQNKIISIREKAKTADACFGFLTDVHLNVNTLKSIPLLKYIDDHTNAVQFVLFGGDVPPATADSGDIILSYGDKWLDQISKFGKDRVFQAKGNHDYMCNLNEGGTFNAENAVDHYYVCKGTERNVVGTAGNMYYYFDDQVNKIRYIVLDNYDYGYSNHVYNTAKMSQAQYEWLISALNVSGYDILVMSHQTADSTLSNYASSLLPLHNILKAFVGKTSLSYSGNDVTLTGDFTGNTSRLICHLSGHSHRDESHVEDGVLSIVTVCDAYYQDPSGYTREMYHISEQAFDVFCITKATKTINTTRIGAGSDRLFTY